MAEVIGDWTVKMVPEYGWVVEGWGLRWFCDTQEAAREVAELLNHVGSKARDVGTL